MLTKTKTKPTKYVYIDIREGRLPGNKFPQKSIRGQVAYLYFRNHLLQKVDASDHEALFELKQKADDLAYQLALIIRNDRKRHRRIKHGT